MSNPLALVIPIFIITNFLQKCNDTADPIQSRKAILALTYI